MYSRQLPSWVALDLFHGARLVCAGATRAERAGYQIAKADNSPQGSVETLHTTVVCFI